MSGHPDDTRLNDYVDGTLSGAEQEATAAHVGACLDCRRRAASLGALRAALASLPRDIAPPDDVLAAVHEAIDRQAVPAVGAARRRRAALAAAAAVALVAASSAVTALLLRPDPPVAAVDSGRPGSVRLVAAHPLEHSWQDAIAELQRELDSSDSTLSPETRQVLESSLQLIDHALQEARAALLADPSNAALADVLRSGYERKLDVLRSAAEHTRPAS